MSCLQGSKDSIAFAALKSAQDENLITARTRAPQDISKTPASMSSATEKSFTAAVSTNDREPDGVISHVSSLESGLTLLSQACPQERGSQIEVRSSEEKREMERLRAELKQLHAANKKLEAKLSTARIRAELARQRRLEAEEQAKQEIEMIRQRRLEAEEQAKQEIESEIRRQGDRDGVVSHVSSLEGGLTLFSQSCPQECASEIEVRSSEKKRETERLRAELKQLHAADKEMEAKMFTERMRHMKAEFEMERQRRLEAEEELKQLRMPPTKGMLLDSRLPRAKDISSMKNSSSHAINRRIPAGVKSMSIRNKVIEFRRALPSDFLLESAIPLHESAQPEGYIAGDEKGLGGVFMHFVAPSLNSITKHRDIRTSDVKTCGLDLGKGLSTADHISTYTVGGKCRVLVPMEMKCNNFNPGHECIVKQYNNDVKTVVDGIWQTCGHLVDNDCEWAIFTTYNTFQAFRLDEFGWLHISEEFLGETEGPASVMNLLYWLLCTAHQRKLDKNSTWKCPYLMPVRDGKENQVSQISAGGRTAAGPSAKTSQKESVLKQHNPHTSNKLTQRACALHGDGKVFHTQKTFSFLFYGVLQEHPTCQTLKAQLQETGQDVVIKCFFHEYDRDNEVKCYVAAKELQGKVIPEMLGTCLLAETRQCRHALVLSFCPGGNYDRLPTEVYYKVKECIARLHQCGVAHGEINARNMSYSFITGSLFLYGFSNGRTCGGPAASREDRDEFAKVCIKDLQFLEELIEESQTASARAWQYAEVP